MLSMPPTARTLYSPALIASAASMADFSPEPHTALTVKEPISTGRPAPMAACLAGFCPRPAPMTLPIMHSSMSVGWRPALLTASFTTIAPRSVALNPAIAFPYFPMGVLTALIMTASSMGYPLYEAPSSELYKRVSIIYYDH